MEFVSTKADLFTNIHTIDSYLAKKSGDDFNFALDLIRNGKVFVSISKKERYSFYPSRFMGNKNNTRTLHKQNSKKNGLNTNKEIRKILDKNLFMDKLESEYIKYCNSLGIMPKNNKRSFWILD